jgi:uncharacterized repeat protein (TIGR03803 family)
MTPAGSFTLLYAFSDPHGAGPNSPLIQATDGSLYGTTPNGGIYGMGSIFRITTTGVFTLLYSFNSPDGAYPAAGLLQATNGMLYGTTEFGGGSTGSGTIFQSDLTGALTTLYSFSGADGANSVASLVQATDGNLYGTTAGGGSYGTIFKITLSGVFTQLVSFDGTDGANPECALLQGSDRNLYGTTKGGGSSGLGTVFQLNVGLMKTGTVQVTTNSPQATFTLFGPTTYTGSGTSATFSDVPIGSYTILFGAASDLTAPWPQTEKLITNKTIAFAGTYSPLAPPCSSPYVCGCVMDDTYKNVPSYYNGTNPILSCNGPGAFGEQYQCVEYVKRFYAEAKAIDTLGWHGNGSQYYSMAAAFGLVADPPTCTTYPQTPCPSSTLPVPDDIVSFCNFNHLTGVCETPGTQYPGHVAIVKSVTVHGTTATVTFVEENYSPSGRIDLTATVTQNADGAYTMAPRANNTLKAYGWLRLPPAATKSTH